MQKKDLAVQLIKKFEGFKTEAYLCPAGIPTIGYGTICYPDGKNVKIGETCIELQAEAYLKSYVQQKVYPIVDKFFANKIPSEDLYAAVCSIVYNCGAGVLAGESFIHAKSTMKYDDFAAAFKKWNKIRVDGELVVSRGLSNRREEEIKQFMKYT